MNDKTIIRRSPKGEDYVFIRLSNFKVCVTRDEYFDSDDEHYESGNYFHSSETAKKCVGTLRELYGERLESLAYNKTLNEHSFIKSIGDIIKVHKLGVKEAKKAKAADAMLAAFKDYTSNRDRINKDLATTRESVIETIKEFNHED